MWLALRCDFRAPGTGAPPVDIYQPALERCAWADSLGFHSVRFMEHHGPADRPSPLIMAAVASRTRRTQIAVGALIAPVHDPLRITEDAAVLDVVSHGRMHFVLAAGYLDDGFAMFGRARSARRRLLEEAVSRSNSIGRASLFLHGGRVARVTPQPYTRSRPKLILRGSC
jgi:alkanesulfonate monooxygenase SsuD/methylene tetrahydromethanopterin reductase-like flavin-dependent oxidoreductase (luciferase family)